MSQVKSRAAGEGLEFGWDEGPVNSRPIAKIIEIRGESEGC